MHLNNGLSLLYIPDAFAIEHFLEEPYKMLEVKGRTVIDVGAYSGDSAIFFSLKGATNVLAFEPFPFAYKIAQRNIELNKITNITLFNEAIGAEDGFVFVDSEAKGPSTSLKQVGRTKVKMNSFSKLVKEMKLSHASLKLDCEGCEICLLNVDAKILNSFDQIILEYHDEGYVDLNDKLLSCGYKTMIYGANGSITGSPPTTNGLIYARL